jgi:cadmium resistance protein CadD (predicted permease)
VPVEVHLLRVLRVWAHWIVPLVFMTIGAVIVIESGVLTRLF